MLNFQAIIFDFDGVLLESEFEGNLHIARVLTELGHPTDVEDALRHFMGLNGKDFLTAVEHWLGEPVPDQFSRQMEVEGARALREGIAAVAGAVEFVRSLPPSLPKAVASSSSTRWIRGHLDHLGLAGEFGTHVYSGREHVERGKPAPDIYLHAASELGVSIEDCAILEDSEVGARGALASGATVIGFAAGRHCSDAHADALRSLGVRHVARSFEEVSALLGVDQMSK